MFDIEKLVIGHSASTKDLRHLISVVAPSSSTVLILGETGAGKDVVSRAIHGVSGRKGSLISINCAAIPAELLESELFGHEKGAFTGADTTRKGRFELAAGGTLFLDEIGDMDLALQSKLLRAIENRTIQRVGGGKEIAINFRLLCATHQNLEKLVEEGKFRADLFYRINVFPIHVPTLAERSVDIPLLIDTIMKQSDTASALPMFDETAQVEMAKYTWPGNIRELRNVIERAIVLFPGKSISGKEVRENLLRLKVPSRSEEQDALWAASADLAGVFGDSENEADDGMPLPHPSHYQQWFAYFDHIDMRRHLRDIEVVLIEAALEKTNGTISGAADALKLRRTTLIEKMKKLMIERPIAPPEDESKAV
jgi:sigma-54 specific flagellar transcriptional regulator A